MSSSSNEFRVAPLSAKRVAHNAQRGWNRGSLNLSALVPALGRELFLLVSWSEAMSHPLYDVTDFEIVGDYTLRVTFDDKTEQVINFEPVLAGYYYAPLRDLKLFNQVRLDREIRNLVWPNGADFDPANLHDWPEVAQEFALWAASLRQAKIYDSSKELMLAMA